jgi:hypothetical protein
MAAAGTLAGRRSRRGIPAPRRANVRPTGPAELCGGCEGRSTPDRPGITVDRPRASPVSWRSPHRSSRASVATTRRRPRTAGRRSRRDHPHRTPPAARRPALGRHRWVARSGSMCARSTTQRTPPAGGCPVGEDFQPGYPPGRTPRADLAATGDGHRARDQVPLAAPRRNGVCARRFVARLRQRVHPPVGHRPHPLTQPDSAGRARRWRPVRDGRRRTWQHGRHRAPARCCWPRWRQRRHGRVQTRHVSATATAKPSTTSSTASSARCPRTAPFLRRRGAARSGGESDRAAVSPGRAGRVRGNPWATVSR